MNNNVVTPIEIIRIYVFDKLGFYKISKKTYTKYQKNYHDFY